MIRKFKFHDFWACPDFSLSAPPLLSPQLCRDRPPHERMMPIKKGVPIFGTPFRYRAGGGRTHNQRIMRPLLKPLSYSPAQGVRDGRGDCKEKMRVFASCRDVLDGLACKAEELRGGNNASSSPFFRTAA